MHLPPRIALALVGLAVFRVGDATQYPLRLSTECGTQSACVRMDFDVSKAARGRTTIRGGVYDPEKTIRALVRGRLNSRPERDHALLVEGTEDTFGCADFAGTGGVLVVGFTEAGQPIILTSAGELALNDTAYSVGCPTCGELRALPDYRRVAVVPTPAWDLWSLKYNPASLTYDDTGTLYVPVGERCVAVTARRRFQLVGRAQCTGLELLGNYEQQVAGLRLEPAEWLFRAPGRKYVLFLAAGACT